MIAGVDVVQAALSLLDALTGVPGLGARGVRHGVLAMVLLSACAVH